MNIKQTANNVKETLSRIDTRATVEDVKDMIHGYYIKGNNDHIGRTPIVKTTVQTPIVKTTVCTRVQKQSLFSLMKKSD
jgi:hypothetical protein